MPPRQVEADLTAPGHPEIFVIGDTATSTPGTANPCRASPRRETAGLARGPYHQAAPARDGAARPFRYKHSGNLATIGKRVAVIDFGWIKVRGRWLVDLGLAHIYFLIGVRNRLPSP